MKVAFIGNMNNNNFSMMRYFRDLGVDAHLLLWSNDGKNSLSHFTPTNDTWSINKWEKYIHRLKIQNGRAAFIGHPKSLVFPPSKKELDNAFAGYDYLIGSGLAPAILGRCNRALDIFYPYSTGIEFLGSRPDVVRLKTASLILGLVYKYLHYKQKEGIQRAHHCVNSEMGLTKKVLESIGKKFVPLAIPMVYVENQKLSNVPNHLMMLKKKLDQFEFKCFSHGRQQWVPEPGYSNEDWMNYCKNNDWLIHGFAKFLKMGPSKSAVLILLEYGLDVGKTKELISDLGLERNVLWVPKSPRKELMYILNLCDVGVGEFTTEPGCIWGGTGWEVLASGKPLLQSFNFSDEGFWKEFDHEPPPILDAKSADSISTHLQSMYSNKELAIKIGNESKDWFNKYNGIGLAKKWLNLLIEHQEK